MRFDTSAPVLLQKWTPSSVTKILFEFRHSPNARTRVCLGVGGVTVIFVEDASPAVRMSSLKAFCPVTTQKAFYSGCYRFAPVFLSCYSWNTPRVCLLAAIWRPTMRSPEINGISKIFHNIQKIFYDGGGVVLRVLLHQNPFCIGSKNASWSFTVSSIDTRPCEMLINIELQCNSLAARV